MKDHEQRVVHEKHELDERIGKLEKFIVTPTCLSLTFAERTLLADQLRVMKEYSSILGQRISLFPKD